jgi:ankyrin repeat protein
VWAAQQGHAACVKALLDAGADKDSPKTNSSAVSGTRGASLDLPRESASSLDSPHGAKA